MQAMPFNLLLVKSHTRYLHDDSKYIVGNQWRPLSILGVDVIVHDFDSATKVQQADYHMLTLRARKAV